MINVEQTKTHIGVDFGTLNSMGACVYEAGLSSLVPERFRSVTIPSIFWQPPEGEPRVAFDAIEGEWNDIGGFVRSVKMKLNESEIRLHDKVYSPKQIIMAILKYVFDIANEAMEEHDIDLPEDNNVVMGIPINFGFYERQLLSDVCTSLGYRAQFLPEPMAGAVYYAYNKEKKDSAGFDKVLVFDMGAGTFDSAFLIKNKLISNDEPYPYICPKKGFNGNRLAGDVIDKKLAEYMLQKLKPEFSDELLKRLSDKNQFIFAQLKNAAMYIKEKLSVRTSYEHSFSLGKQPFSIELSSDELNKVAAPVIDEAVRICSNIVRDCQMENEDFDIIMIGGMSNLPLVKESLAKAFPKQASRIKKKEPSRAVAFGCAIYSQQPKLGRRVTFGYAVESFKDNRQVLAVEIPSDVKLPFTVESRYETRVESQSAMEFMFYEVPNARKGEYLELSAGKYSDCKVVHRFRSPVPKGTRVECRIKLDESGILNITIDDGNPDHEPTVKKFNIGISKFEDYYISKTESL